MTMLDIFRETVAALPVELNIVSVKNGYSKTKVVLEHGGITTWVDLHKTCAPGEERKYCWQVAACAMSAIYLTGGDLQKAELWMEAMQDKSLITAENG